MEPSAIDRDQRIDHSLAVAMIIALATQFLLGMISVIYVAFPAPADSSVRWDFTWAHAVSVSHITVGSILIVLGLVMLVRAYRRGTTASRLSTLVGSVSVVVAAVSGMLFVSQNQPIFSLTMALGFLCAMVAYVLHLGVVALPRR
jgi:hypothetical protein